MANTDRECTACGEIVLESENMWNITITKTPGYEEFYCKVCEKCRNKIVDIIQK